MAAEHHYLKRTAVSDANLQTGRYAILGSEEAAGLLIGVDPKPLLTISSYRGGVFCRYVNTSNWLMLVKTSYTGLIVGGVFQLPTWSLIKRKEGTETVLASGTFLNSFYLWVGKDGNWQAYTAGLSSSPTAFSTAPDVDLVSGAKLGKGKYGIYDAYTSAEAKERQYRNFEVITAAKDPVLFANLEARLTYQGHFRRSADNAAWGPVYRPGSDLPRLPVSGAEARPVEIGVRPSRGDFGQLPDSGLDKVKVTPTYRPCWSYVPET